MRNLHTLITGMTGAGKTTIARALLDLTARAVVFDRKHEYNPRGGAFHEELRGAAEYLLSRGGKPLKLVFRPRDPADYMALLEIVMAMQDTHPEYGPIVVFAEEASAYSETFKIDPVLREAYNAGRHLSLSLLTVIQLDTDIHRVTRGNSEIIVTTAVRRLSVDMSRYFVYSDLEHLQSLRERYVYPPVQGVHFAVYPPGVDLYDEWWQTHGYILVPQYAPLPIIGSEGVDNPPVTVVD